MVVTLRGRFLDSASSFVAFLLLFADRPKEETILVNRFWYKSGMTLKT